MNFLNPKLSMNITNILRPFLRRKRNSGLPVEIQVSNFTKITFYYNLFDITDNKKNKNKNKKHT